MKPKIVIVVQHGEVVKIVSDAEIFADIEIHDYDKNQKQSGENDELPHELEFFERVYRY